MTSQEQISETAKAIRWVLIGGLICEYGARMLPSSRGELKQRVNAVINFSQRLQSYFLNHQNCSEENRKVFRKEFSKNEVVLMAELLETVWGLDENSLDEIIKTIQLNIVSDAG